MKHTLALLILIFLSSYVLFSQTNNNSSIEGLNYENNGLMSLMMKIEGLL